jgi:hypothetical protein
MTIKEVKKRKFFNSLEKFNKEREKDRVRVNPGEKTEEEIRLYGRGARKEKPKFKVRLKREKEEVTKDIKLEFFRIKQTIDRYNILTITVNGELVKVRDIMDFGQFLEYERIRSKK